jgi:hypothetical protein
MRALLLLLFFLPVTVYSQLRFKPSIDGGAGFSKENFYVTTAGLTIEKKIDIDKSFETGIFHHNFEFYSKKNPAFYQAFIKGTDLDGDGWDTTSYVNVKFNFVDIPIGFNYYVTPKFYIGYKLGFNFFTRSTYTGIDARGFEDPVDGFETYKREFDRTKFRKFYLNHTISFNVITLRRIDLGLGMMFTPRGKFLKASSDPLYKSFNDEVSRYFAISIHFKVYLFQIKSRSL